MRKGQLFEVNSRRYSWIIPKLLIQLIYLRKFLMHLSALLPSFLPQLMWEFPRFSFHQKVKKPFDIKEKALKLIESVIFHLVNDFRSRLCILVLFHFRGALKATQIRIMARFHELFYADLYCEMLQKLLIEFHSLIATKFFSTNFYLLKILIVTPYKVTPCIKYSS